MTENVSTTRTQSRRLLDCGIDPMTADMLWYGNYEFPEVRKVDRRLKDYLPAWSLSRLLELLPQRVIAPHGDTPCDLYIHHYPKFWLVMYHDGKTSGDPDDYIWQCGSEQRAKTLIEACVKTLEWLNNE